MTLKNQAAPFPLRTLWVCLIATMGALAVPQAQALSVQKVTAGSSENGTRVMLEFDEPVPQGVLVFRSGSALKQVVELPVAVDNARLDDIQDPTGMIKKIALMKGDGRSRILMDLQREMDLRWDVSGNTLTLTWASPPAAGRSVGASAAPTLAGAATAATAPALLPTPISAKPAPVKAAAIRSSTTKPTQVAAATPVAVPPALPPVATSAAVPVSIPQVRLQVTDLDDRAEIAFLTAQGQASLAPVQMYRIASPERQVIDVAGVLMPEQVKAEVSKSSRFGRVEVLTEKGNTRVVLELKQPYGVERKSLAEGQALVVSGPRPYQNDSLSMAGVRPESPVVSVLPKDTPLKNSPRLQRWSAGMDDTDADILSLEFDRATVLADASVRAGVLRVRLQHADWDEANTDLKRMLKGRLFSEAKIEKGTQGLNLVVKLDRSTHQLRQDGNVLQISLRPDGSRAADVVSVAANSAQAARGLRAGVSDASRADPMPLSSVSHYRGRPISLNFKDTDIRTVMQVFAEFTSMNLVLSDTVKGKVTVYLDNVPWDQALEIVLKAKNLVARKSGNVLLVSPQEELAAATTQAQAIQSSDDLDPLIQKSFVVSYQKVASIVDMLTKKESRLMSSRGSVLADERTSQLFIEDTPKRVERIGSLIQQLDKPVKQVMIEAKVVLADTRVSKELSAAIKASALSGERLQTIPTQLGTGGLVDSDTASSINGAYTLLTSGGTRFVNIQLKALESTNRVKTVSNPRVVTSNKETAIIEQGTEIPYRVATSSGATSIEFREASLKLEVTPQIAPDGTVLLEVDVSKDSVGQQTTDGLAIDTRHVKTKVSVLDGGTVVLGGIIEKGSNNQVSKIPLLGDIPFLGHLFKGRVESEADAELLIFLTPVVLKDS